MEPRQKTEKHHFSMFQELPSRSSKKCQQLSLFIQKFQFTNFLLNLEGPLDCGWEWEPCSSVSLEFLYCQILKGNQLNKPIKFHIIVVALLGIPLNMQHE